MFPRALAFVFALAVLQAAAPAWTVQTSGVTAGFRGVSAVSDTVVWASGTNGTVVRTSDGGATWQKLTVPDAAALDFRDIDAVDANTAYVLSIDMGKSHVFKTTDAGAHWVMQFTPEPNVFLDAMSFSDATHGFAIADSIDGKFVLFATSDGDRWARVPPESLPAALPNEGAFSASGSNIAVLGSDVWIAMGSSRVLRSHDRGRTWQISTAPVPASEAAGVFSIAFRDATHGIVVGGDYQKTTQAIDNCAITSDGGATWTLVKGVSGYRSAVAYVPHAKTPSLIAVGPSGADFSADDGTTWTPMAMPAFPPLPGRRANAPAAPSINAFAFSPTGNAGWAVGARGWIVRLDGAR